MKRPVLAAMLALACAAAPGSAEDSALRLPIGDPARRDHTVPVVLDAVTDAARGDTLTPPELAARLDGVKLVFVGENHTDVEFHRVQLQLIEELHRRGRQVLVGLEMYPVTEQKWLDRWHADRRFTEERFLAESRWYRNWGYHWNYYRDIFLFARASGIRMFAVNLPRGVVSTVRSQGFDALPPEQRAMLPPRVDLENAEHQRLFRAFFDSGDALHGNLPEAMFQALFRAQCAWDAAMGWNAVQALKQYGRGDAIMVVLIGAGHAAYGLGAERQARLWFDGRTASVLPTAIADGPNEPLIAEVQASYADFVWGLPPVTDPMYPSVGISTPEQKSGEHFRVILVQKGSPGEAAGFEVGDELVSIDGEPIDGKETANVVMSRKRWGDTVEYRIVRGGAERALTVHLRRTPPPAPGGKAAAPDGEPPAPPDMPPGMPHGPDGPGKVDGGREGSR
jgi:uncharacterized iron-regulated protein